MQYQIFKIKPASDEIQMEKILTYRYLITNLYHSLTCLNCLILYVDSHKKMIISHIQRRAYHLKKGSPSYTKRSNYHFQSIYRWNTISTVIFFSHIGWIITSSGTELQLYQHRKWWIDKYVSDIRWIFFKRNCNFLILFWLEYLTKSYTHKHTHTYIYILLLLEQIMIVIKICCRHLKCMIYHMYVIKLIIECGFQIEFNIFLK